jgi:AraC-like DNA-binding protein
VFVYKDSRTEAKLLKAVESISGQDIALNLLASVENKLAVLPPSVTEAIVDLFVRPSRYDTGADLAREAELPVKRLYQEFSKAGLRPPKQLVACAKAIHGYGYLQFSKYPERLVRKKLGYSDPQSFSRQVASVLGCRPKELRQTLCSEELLLRLIEWMYKPSALTRKRSA